MKANKLEDFKILFERFKTNKEYSARIAQSEFSFIAKEIIIETLKNKDLKNEHLSGFIQMFKLNTATLNFENYLISNINDDVISSKILDKFKSLEQRGYTLAGKYKISKPTTDQLSQIKTFLLSALDVKTIEDGILLIKEFESFNIPEVKRGIYSPWLHYINPDIFPVFNNSSNAFCKWLGIQKADYTKAISDYNFLKNEVGSSLACLDVFIWTFNKYKNLDELNTKVFAIKLTDEKLNSIFGLIKDKDGKHSNIIRSEYNYRNNIEEYIKSNWVLGAYTSLRGIDLDGDKDRTDYFVNNNIWVNGYTIKYSNEVNSIRVGDEVAIKSVFRIGGKSVMRIKAIGVVLENLKDGRTIKVDWKKDFNTFDLDFTGGYWATISKVKKDEHIQKIWN